MSVADTDLMRGASLGRVVWTGRWPELVSGGIDAFSHGRTDLLGVLDATAELVVLDVLSFPWESLRPSDRDIPLVLVMPSSLDADTISMVLGEPVLRHLTSHDLLVESRVEVRDALSTAWGLGPSQWLAASDGSPRAAAVAIESHGRTRLTTVDTPFGPIAGPSGDLITQHLADYGAHQRGSLNVLLAVLEPGAVVVDVGAHVGTIAIPLARQVGGDGRVLAIEGHATTAALLRHNVRANGLDDVITTRHAVVAELDGQWQVPEVSGRNTGATTFRGQPRRMAHAVATTSLDSLLADVAGFEADQVDLVKIDVEGAELAVLEGAGNLLDASRPMLFIEVSASQLADAGTSITALDGWLRDRGHHLFAVGGVRNMVGSDIDLAPVQSLNDVDDVLFDILAIPSGSPHLATARHLASS